MASNREREQEKRQRRIVTAKEWASEQETFARTTLAIPQGATVFNIKKAGTYKLDFMPYEVTEHHPKVKSGELWKGDLNWEFTYHIHNNIGPSERKYVCLAETFGEPCPICEHRNAKMKAGMSREDARPWAASKRQLFNVIDVTDQEGANKGVQIFDYSYFLFGEKLKKKVDHADPDEDYDLFMTLDKGMTLKLGFDKSPKGDWYECVDIEFRPRKRPYDEDILKETYDLFTIVKKTPYAELKRIFDQEPSDTDEGGGEESSSRSEVVQSPSPRTRPSRTDRSEEAEVAPPSSKRTPPNPVEAPRSKQRNADEEEETEEPSSRRREEPLPKSANSGVRIYKVGDVVIFNGGRCEVTHVSREGNLLTMEEEESGDLHRGISPDEVEYAGSTVEEEEVPPQPRSTKSSSRYEEDNGGADGNRRSHR